MGTVYRKTATKPLPSGAKLIVRKGERLAEWADAKKKRRTAPVTIGQDGTDRIVITARTFTAKYRNGKGHVVEVATGCRDETAARAVLNDLEKRADKVRSGLRTGAEDSAVDHLGAKIAEHFHAFLDYLTLKGTCSRPKETRAQLQAVADACGWRTLAKVDAEPFQRWLLEQARAKMSAARRNKYRGTWVSFCNWCVTSGRMTVNPLSRVPKADEAAGMVRQRRALDEGDLTRLLEVAQLRPLAEFGRLSVRKDPDAVKAKRDTWQAEQLTLAALAGAVERARLRLRRNPAFVAKLDGRGRERALIYKTLVLTGLRKGELASLSVGQLYLDSDPAYLVLDAADEKNREGNTLVVRSDLAADLRLWLADKAATLADSKAQTIKFDPQAVRRAERDTSDSRGPYGLPADTPVFDVSAGLVRILDRDMTAAGIPKRDDRGRTVDVHALRTTFGTLLSKVGVAPRTAQEAMRHSDIRLTMGAYTDPRLLDVAGAVELLPALPLTKEGPQNEAAARATGTDGSLPSEGVRKFAPGFAPNTDKSATPRSILDLLTTAGDDPRGETKRAGFPGENRVFSEKPTPSCKWAIKDSNLRHPPCKGGALTN